jgi:hypothetical protein
MTVDRNGKLTNVVKIALTAIRWLRQKSSIAMRRRETGHRDLVSVKTNLRFSWR